MKPRATNQMNAEYKKLKSIQDGDNVEINGTAFHVGAVHAMDKGRSFQMELQASDGGLVTFIGVPGVKLRVASTDD